MPRTIKARCTKDGMVYSMGFEGSFRKLRILQLKQHLQDLTGIAVDQQELVFNGRVVNDGMSCRDLGMEDGSVITLNEKSDLLEEQIAKKEAEIVQINKLIPHRVPTPKAPPPPAPATLPPSSPQQEQQERFLVDGRLQSEVIINENEARLASLRQQELELLFRARKLEQSEEEFRRRQENERLRSLEEQQRRQLSQVRHAERSRRLSSNYSTDQTYPDPQNVNMSLEQHSHDSNSQSSIKNSRHSSACRSGRGQEQKHPLIGPQKGRYEEVGHLEERGAANFNSESSSHELGSCNSSSVVKRVASMKGSDHYERLTTPRDEPVAVGNFGSDLLRRQQQLPEAEMSSRRPKTPMVLQSRSPTAPQEDHPPYKKQLTPEPRSVNQPPDSNKYQKQLSPVSTVPRSISRGNGDADEADFYYKGRAPGTAAPLPPPPASLPPRGKVKWETVDDNWKEQLEIEVTAGDDDDDDELCVVVEPIIETPSYHQATLTDSLWNRTPAASPALSTRTDRTARSEYENHLLSGAHDLAWKSSRIKFDAARQAAKAAFLREESEIREKKEVLDKMTLEVQRDLEHMRSKSYVISKALDVTSVPRMNGQ
eukprot:TRINITY_DN7728_c2_g1_i1.p2 TRINITY_DN7728_c2_g1~~TRINITY_DN7728_c2_g1_i1.p2  ORF type:complete len:597 (+),score=127.03 TRINITY_DN7728_c2_g1_i1:32-1822(+)